MDYDWQNFLIDLPIVAHVFLDLRVSEGMGPAVVGGNDTIRGMAGRCRQVLIGVKLHLLIIIPLLWIGLFHSQEKAYSKFSDHLSAISIRELVTVRVQETNAEPLLPIGQTLRLDFKELQQVTSVGRLIHFLLREDREQALNDVISNFRIVQSRTERRKGVSKTADHFGEERLAAVRIYGRC
jgi:hypothetical protein